MENRIGRPQLGNAFARLFGLDDINTIASVAPEVMPVLSLDDRPEYQLLRGTKLMGISFDLSAVAAQIGYVTLVNPSSSGIIAVIEDVLLTVGSGEYGIGTQALGESIGGTLGQGFHRDARYSASGAAADQLGGGIKPYGNTSGGGDPYVIQGRLSQGVLKPIDIIIPPGFAFGIGHTTANNALQGSVRWREIRIMSQDLAGV